MKSLMDKIVSPPQNAFVPGRRISNNILLGQELFHGYNRQHLPPRCALKVDLRKAYDTLDWDFIEAMLHLFGFPDQFIHWIMECISTTAFSVALNGELHGFFLGARGVRQGDPMSPYLFVLAMEVLHLMLVQRIEQTPSF
ncbi:UNVERIFIED_CONTAM: Retrovirus-related Pol polyprotein from type-2 retrotransposable element R2DM [Sesamum radiatum]|uniref:Retrovirus-related Pol polyprotein from type-2 retrotransposable element R2DM n=1 Tax=Sesamum radiatum TaxID=300843 RepID=A0AAW2JJQ6_SESRA